MLKIDHYNIAKNVHVFRQGNLNIAYDVNSGSLHIVDDKTAQFIINMIQVQIQDLKGTGDPHSIFRVAGADLSGEEKNEILMELGALQRNNLLFSQEAEKIEPMYPEPPIIKAMCLHVAHDCNLRCRYCFAGTGPFGGSRQLMSFKTGKSALDFLLRNSGNRAQCEVDFFGGEPLLNFDVVKELISYGKKAAAQIGKKIKFTLTTNAVLLNEEVSGYLEEEGISIVLSLDGRKEVNDRMRPYAGGKGSYDRIMPQILRFIEKRPAASRYAIGKYYYVRGTYTRYNMDFYQDVLHMADQGIKRISVEPVVAPPEEEYALREEDLDTVKKSYDILGEKVLEYMQNGKEFSFFHFNAGLDDGPCLPKRLSGCGAGHEYVAISPEGEIYPCHQFVGQEKYKLGSLYEEEKLNAKVVAAFRKAHVYIKEECGSCWARFSCSGGCHAANAAFSGELTKVYSLGCELQKKRLEVAFYIKIREREQRVLV
ncbi:MAG: Anaerobic sulfatase-maturating enzyme [Candidatus Dichloromethanomonas elyunquensis]|nr:MAG: Anaerobic sulfatase-maturating enzyme [Candidatus Dichloromethanomonas elyunquensis]